MPFRTFAIKYEFYIYNKNWHFDFNTWQNFKSTKIEISIAVINIGPYI